MIALVILYVAGSVLVVALGARHHARRTGGPHRHADNAALVALAMVAVIFVTAVSLAVPPR